MDVEVVLPYFTVLSYHMPEGMKKTEKHVITFSLWTPDISASS
jgi:hypothetical protein